MPLRKATIRLTSIVGANGTGSIRSTWLLLLLNHEGYGHRRNDFRLLWFGQCDFGLLC